MEKKQKFINKSILLYGNKYDYSKVTYINSITKIKIICPKHGMFEQEPRKFLKIGCLKCI